MAQIIDVHARQILDSRGNPTVEVEILTEEFIGSAAVPSGASTGVHEAHELRDKTKKYHGKSVEKAVKNVNTIIRDSLIGKELDQEEIDTHLRMLDGTPNKKKLGANAILGVSLAASRAASASHDMALHSYIAKIAGTQEKIPLLFANVINGGVHAGNDLMPQEFMIVSHAKKLEDRVRITSEIYQELKIVIAKKYGSQATSVGDEGGFAPPVKNCDEAFKLLMSAIKNAGYEGKISFAMDPAASEFYRNKKYEIEKGIKLSGEELAQYWMKLLKKYPIMSIEDPFAEDDFVSWNYFMRELETKDDDYFAYGKAPQVVGDDLTVSNPERIVLAAEKGLCNALLLKVNQIGTLSEAIDATTIALDAGWKVMVSHRSGETEDPYIADLAVGLGTGQIKIGAPCRSDRTAKYNQLLRISSE